MAVRQKNSNWAVDFTVSGVRHRTFGLPDQTTAEIWEPMARQAVLSAASLSPILSRKFTKIGPLSIGDFFQYIRAVRFTRLKGAIEKGGPRALIQAASSPVARWAGLVLLAIGLTGCTVTASTYHGPIVVRLDDEPMLVIRALDPPQTCRVVAADAVFPAIYAVVAGPMPQSEAEAFIGAETRRAGGACAVNRRP